MAAVSEPTPIRQRNHVTRPKRLKLAAVMAADMVGVVQASKQTGIPESSIRVWIDKPEFAEIRAKTREDLAEEVKVVAHLAWRRVGDLMPTMEPRDAIFASEKASTILALLRGEATSRTETRDLTDTLDDHERAALRSIVDEVLAATEADV